MSFNVKISMNIDELAAGMRLAEKQVSFATSLALTMTAGTGKVKGVKGIGGARTDLKRSIKKYMEVRGKRKNTGGWMGGSVKSSRASKSKMHADVGTINQDLADQAQGATRTGKDAGAVPQVGMGMPRPTIQDVTDKSTWPKTQLKDDMSNRPGHRRLFIIDAKHTKSGNSLVMKKTGPMVWRRRRRAGTVNVIRTSMRGAGGDATVMWSIANSVKLPPIWPFEMLVKRSVAKHWQENAVVAFQHAFETRR